GTVLGGAGAGFMAGLWGWRPPLFVLALIGLVVALLAHVFIVDPSAPSKQERDNNSSDSRPTQGWQSVQEIFRVPSYLILAGEAMLVAVGVLVFFYFVVRFFS